MVRLIRFALSVLILLIIVGGPLSYLRYEREHCRNFQVVHPGVLYRSGQLSLDGLKDVLHDHGINTVISLRYPQAGEELPPDADEELYCRRNGIRYFRIRPLPWSSPDGAVPAETALAEFFEVMDQPENYPVLIHCFAGAHRTGSFCAVYRMEYQGWTITEALTEMRQSGYETLSSDRDIFDYLQSYRTRLQKQQTVQQHPAGHE